MNIHHKKNDQNSSLVFCMSITKMHSSLYLLVFCFFTKMKTKEKKNDGRIIAVKMFRMFHFEKVYADLTKHSSSNFWRNTHHEPAHEFFSKILYIIIHIFFVFDTFLRRKKNELEINFVRDPFPIWNNRRIQFCCCYSNLFLFRCENINTWEDERRNGWFLKPDTHQFEYRNRWATTVTAATTTMTTNTHKMVALTVNAKQKWKVYWMWVRYVSLSLERVWLFIFVCDRTVWFDDKSLLMHLCAYETVATLVNMFWRMKRKKPIILIGGPLNGIILAIVYVNDEPVCLCARVRLIEHLTSCDSSTYRLNCADTKLLYGMYFAGLAYIRQTSFSRHASLSPARLSWWKTASSRDSNGL